MKLYLGHSFCFVLSLNQLIFHNGLSNFQIVTGDATHQIDTEQAPLQRVAAFPNAPYQWEKFKEVHMLLLASTIFWV